MSNDFDEYDDEEEIILISKSHLKRESQSLQELGRELVELPANKLAKVPLTPQLEEAIALAHSIKARGGLKRQLQYIGKLLRNSDAEPIIAAMAEIRNSHIKENARLHRLERWRDRLIDEQDQALGELLQEFPGAELQHLRQLIRNARRELEQQKPPKSAREIFRYLRDLAPE